MSAPDPPEICPACGDESYASKRCPNCGEPFTEKELLRDIRDALETIASSR